MEQRQITKQMTTTVVGSRYVLVDDLRITASELMLVKRLVDWLRATDYGELRFIKHNTKVVSEFINKKQDIIDPLNE